MLFSDTGPSGVMSSLLRAELDTGAPACEWTCESVEIPPARDMPERVAAAVDEKKPAAVVMSFSASYFTYDFVIARVRRRWPRLYGLTQALTRELRDAAGGGWSGGQSVRGLLYRAPRWLGARLIGAEPFMKVEHAAANACAALSYLAAREEIVVVCKLPAMQVRVPAADLSRYRARLEQFKQAVAATCAGNGISTYELEDALRRAGRNLGIVADGIHADLPTRKFDAGLMAGQILAAGDFPEEQEHQLPRARAPRKPFGPGAGSL
jgi:hypothetical protein